MYRLIALTLVVAALLAVGLTRGSPTAAAANPLSSASLTQTAGFIVCHGPSSVTVTVSRSSRPAVLARVQAALPRTIPASRTSPALPDTGRSALVLVFRNGTRRTYVNRVPPSLFRVAQILTPLVHL